MMTEDEGGEFSEGEQPGELISGSEQKDQTKMKWRGDCLIQCMAQVCWIGFRWRAAKRIRGEKLHYPWCCTENSTNQSKSWQKSSANDVIVSLIFDKKSETDVSFRQEKQKDCHKSQKHQDSRHKICGFSVIILCQCAEF